MACPATVGSSSSPALSFRIVAECSRSRARTSLMKLPHYTVETPTFMPVGTQGTMKGLLPQQVKDAGASLILGNTYHLGTRPGKENMERLGGLHKLMSWDRALLTDSGGFQMVSLLKLAEITEDGVKFSSPYDGSECLLTPEESIAIQNTIGGDIMMQLDDVVNVVETDYKRFELATHRTTRWLDRCMAANKNPSSQNLFPIVQGGLFPDLRQISLQQLIARDAPGYAIGGLSGGEDKDRFWPVVLQCTEQLPKNKPRYCMGVGVAIDLVVCCAMGVDMFDCVFPTRTARFGCALVDHGQINLKSREFSGDLRPIDESCDCTTCQTYTRAYLNTIVTREPVACHLLSVHNIAYQMRLMKQIRESIKGGRFEDFVQEFVEAYYRDGECPKWVTDALAAVNIHLTNKKTCRSPEGKRGLDEVWNEEDDEASAKERRKGKLKERVTGLQSGFDRLNLAGYREAVLGEFDHAEELGRQKGFQQGFVADPETNPTLALACMEGQLMALSSRSSQGGVQTQSGEEEQLLKNVRALMDQCYNSPPHPEEGTAAAAAAEDSQRWRGGECDGISLKKLQESINKLYTARGWTLPSLP